MVTHGSAKFLCPTCQQTVEVHFILMDGRVVNPSILDDCHGVYLFDRTPQGMRLFHLSEVGVE